MNIWREFHGPNAGYILELYDRYLRDPQSVDPASRELFRKWKPELDGVHTTQSVSFGKIVGAVNLAQAIRTYGHLAARLDPLGSEPPGDPSLNPETHGLTDDDLRELPASLVGGPVAENAVNALEAIATLRKVHSSTTGFDYEHVHIPEEREWLRHAAESGRFRPPKDPIAPKALLERLTQVEVFERFLHRIFPGKFRFSIEGVDMMVPMFDELIGEAAEAGIHNILLGMAHRGRLNVLAHTLNKPYSQILAKFKDPVNASDFHDDMGWTGDVKYHDGARRALKNGKQIDLVVTLAPNPSHLEAVNPVIEGMARAAGTIVNEPGTPKFDHRANLPILIHGDAGFPGQGIVAETLNLSRLQGYCTGGTIHIITNNQLGYTSTPETGRSTLYASDLAKGFEIPIVHVNSDDPEACIEAARMAFAYLALFQKDFLIDLVGYRRHGHNEADEPGFTQPLMYQKIENYPTVRELWAKTLLERNIINKEDTEELIAKYTEQLHRAFESFKPEESIEPQPPLPPPGAASKVKTAVSADMLREIGAALCRLPKDFTIHPKLLRGMERKRKALDNLDEPTIDWAMAEELAYASILADGVAIRLTGQDTERGTFSHRHTVLHDAKNGKIHTPLQALPQAKAAFEIHNSPLTENATVGFEYGYNIQEPSRLVLWEAQYGDFINGAHTIIDEFLTSARAKWGQRPSLVFLLPHGYEGQGPDHSSARLERFLELCADTNMRVANCTTSAQFFHLLRRQAALLKTDPLPLIVMTPKSLLRHPLVASSPREFSEGKWHPMIDDAKARQNPEKVSRLILCSGKVYVDLVSSEYRNRNPNLAIARVEQLYPLKIETIRQIIDGYTKLKEVVWVQEEPENMGAWMFMWMRLRGLLSSRLPLNYIGRRAHSSPAEGSSSHHKINQDALIKQAYNLKSDIPNLKETDIIWLKNI